MKLLYTDRCHQYSEDGVRFKTLHELAIHTDNFLTKKETTKKKEISGEKNHRLWYEKPSQWTNELKDNISNDSSNIKKTENINNEPTKETYVVPADEIFPRCQICKESFETIWDQDEGELYYNNAIKLLVTNKGNSDLFNQGAETLNELVHYCIVHMDGCGMTEFLEQGIADNLHQIKAKYKNKIVTEIFESAIGSDDEVDDIFCILEPT